eukprot:508940-Pyramimonas_sp.AAC.1
MFSWAHDSLRALASELGSGVLYDLRRAIHATTYTTAFSGIDAPGTSAAVLTATLEDMLGGPIQPMRHLASVEISADANRELARQPHSRPEHMYHDIMDFWVPDVAATISRLVNAGRAVTLDDLRPIVKRGGAVRSFAWCA